MPSDSGGHVGILSRMSPPSITALGPVARELLGKRYPVRHPAVTRAELERLLAKAKVTAHAPALAFERSYGGLSFPEHGEGRGWQKTDVVPWLVGAAACLASDHSFHPPGKRKLVPVLCTANDVVYFLDADGAAWAQDTIEEVRPVLFAPTARAMMSRILFWEEIFFCPSDKKVAVAGERGATVASALKLRAVADASDDVERWWSDGTTFVVEQAAKRRAAETTIARPPRGALARLGLPEPAKAPVRTGPVTFDSVVAEYAAFSRVIRVSGKMNAIRQAFFEPSRHAQPCTVEPRVGGTVSLARGKLAGAIIAIDETNPGCVRVQLALAGNPAFTKKTSRVELFFRDHASSTLVNIFHFDLEDGHIEGVGALWDDVLLAVSRWASPTP